MMPSDEPQDELVRRYLDASAQETLRPDAQVRQSVLAHARLVRDAAQRVAVEPRRVARTAPAANAARWWLPMVAGIAVFGLSALLVLQVDRAPPETREVAMAPVAPTRDAAATVAPAAPTPSPPPAPAVAPAMVLPALAKAQRVPPAQGASADASLSKSAEPRRKPAPEAELAGQVVSAAPAATALARSEPEPTRAAAPVLPLHDAAGTGQTAQVDVLLQQGAPINARDPAGRTPLMLAAIQGQASVVQQLLRAGADRMLVDNEGMTALQHARKLGLPVIAALLESPP